VFTHVRLRMLGWTLLVMGVILALVGSLIYLSLAGSLTAEVDRNLSDRGQEMVSFLQRFDTKGLTLGPDGYRGGYFYLVIDPNGHVLANPQQIRFDVLPLSGPVSSAKPFTTSVLAGEPVRLYLRPLADIGFGSSILVVGQSLASEEQALHRLVVVLIATGIAGLLLCVAGAWFLAGRALVPIQRAFGRQQEFAADAAHELRTPLTVLHAATDLLQQHRTEPLDNNGELFDDVRQEIGRMERLVTDLLTLARSDLGELDLAVGQVNLVPLATEMVRLAAPLAGERGLELTSASDSEPVTVEADPDRLQQVLLILLDNAIKHTPPGGKVTLAARRQGGEALIEVKDTGEGISPEHLPRLFDRFYRADRARSRSGGVGLGLAIAKSLVEAHGGQLSVTSVLGSGVTVTIRLPSVGHAPSLSNRVSHLASRLSRRPVAR